MKHSICQRVLDPVTGLKVTKIEQVTGELGSGITDRNGKEIFEGDRVTVNGCSHESAKGDIVRFFDGGFRILSRTLEEFQRDELEVVGHVDD